MVEDGGGVVEGIGGVVEGGGSKVEGDCVVDDCGVEQGGAAVVV